MKKEIPESEIVGEWVLVRCRKCHGSGDVPDGAPIGSGVGAGVYFPKKECPRCEGVGRLKKPLSEIKDA